MDLESLKSPATIIKTVMFLILAAGLITLYVNTNNMGKSKDCKRYYGANVASSVLIAVYLGYILLDHFKLIPVNN